MFMVTDPGSTPSEVDDACPAWCTYDHLADDWPDDRWHSSDAVDFTLTRAHLRVDEPTSTVRVGAGAAYLAQDWGLDEPVVMLHLPHSVATADQLRLTVNEANDLATKLDDLVERAQRGKHR